MGVRGLTTYISDNSKLFLKPHQLCDCYLIVDGSNISCLLYKWLSNSPSAFGGDYDEYYKTVKDFFSMLKKCNVSPIVLLDGGIGKRKISTRLSRANSKLPILRIFAKGYSSIKFYPIFLKQTFCDVMDELEILYIQCDMEADVEIAAVARSLNCPVLSYDSDFYIFDVLYIPFSSVYKAPVKFNDSNKYYVRCSLYDVTNFLNEFDLLDRSLLPVIATLLGNDYTKSGIFEKFFHHVALSKKKNLTYTQRRIHGVLHWLKTENIESAVKQILNHLDSSSSKKAVKALNSCIDDYTKLSVCESVMENLKSEIGDISLDKKPFLLKLPPQIRNHYSKCRIHNFIADIITLGTYFTFQQVEYVHHQSAHSLCLQLIAHMYTFLAPYLQCPSKPLKVYLTLKNQYQAISLGDYVSNCSNSTTIDDILKESEPIRLKWLYYVLGFDANDEEIVPKSDWSVFILALIFWIKKLNSSISLAHIHALILMAIANQVIQKHVGYFRNYSKFMKRKGNSFTKLKNETVPIGESKDFGEMLQNVTLYEKLLIQSILFPFRQATEKATNKGYCILTLHLFAAFQSCLYHVMQLNALFNYPLPHVKISDFYSGTLLFNFYLSVKTKNEIEKFGCNLFKDAPNIMAIYTYLYESLCDFSEKTAVVVDTHKKKKKKNKKKKCEENICEEEIVNPRLIPDDSNTDTDEYNDQNNPYAVLLCDISCK